MALTMIPAGSLVTMTSSDSPDYYNHGVFRALVDINPVAILAEWIDAHPDMSPFRDFRDRRVLPWLIAKGVVEPIQSFTWRLSDSGMAWAMWTTTDAEGGDEDEDDDNDLSADLQVLHDANPFRPSWSTCHDGAMRVEIALDGDEVRRHHASVHPPYVADGVVVRGWKWQIDFSARLAAAITGRPEDAADGPMCGFADGAEAAKEAALKAAAAVNRANGATR